MSNVYGSHGTYEVVYGHEDDYKDTLLIDTRGTHWQVCIRIDSFEGSTEAVFLGREDVTNLRDALNRILGEGDFDPEPDPDEEPVETENVIHLTPRLDLAGLADEFEEVGRRLRMVS